MDSRRWLTMTKIIIINEGPSYGFRNEKLDEYAFDEHEQRQLAEAIVKAQTTDEKIFKIGNRTFKKGRRPEMKKEPPKRFLCSVIDKFKSIFSCH